jgi:hypothetical protein
LGFVAAFDCNAERTTITSKLQQTKGAPETDLYLPADSKPKVAGVIRKRRRPSLALLIAENTAAIQLNASQVLVADGLNGLGLPLSAR